MTLVLGEEVKDYENENYYKIVIGRNGYCLYCFLADFKLPDICLSKGQGVINYHPCYFIRLTTEKLPSIIFVIRYIQGVECVVLLKDRQDYYNESRLLYTITLSDFMVKFKTVNVVSRMYKTSELQFKAKLYDGINDDIIEKYVSKLSQKLKQNSIKVEPQYFYEIHWYSKCCFYEDYRNNTLEPLVYACLSPEEQEEEDRRKEQERIEKEEQERLIREEQEKQDKKRRIREERERKKQEEINKIEAEKERKRKLQRLHDIENAPRMNKLTGKMYYPNNEFEEVDVDNGRCIAFVRKRKNVEINTDLHDFPNEQTELDLDLNLSPNQNIVFNPNKYIKTTKEKVTKINQPNKPVIAVKPPKQTRPKMKNIQPKSTKLLRERIEATKNKNRVDIATSPTSSHDNDSVIFEEEEEVTANSREAVPDNENNNQQQTQTKNLRQNKTYIPAPPTMKILSEEEIRRRNITAAQTKLTTKAKQIQNKQITMSSREVQQQHTPTKQTDISNEIPQAPKAIKQQNKNKKVYSPTSLNDSILNI